MQLLTIETDPNSAKSRSFSALLLGHIRCDWIWRGGRTETNATRPVWAQFATSEDEMRPFLANLRTGKRATNNTRHSERFEFLKTAGYAFSTQRTFSGMLLTAYLPELFRMDPGMVDPKTASFVALPTRAWVTEQSTHLDAGAAIEHVRKIFKPIDLGIHSDSYYTKQEKPVAERFADRVRELLPLATLFAAYLDRRTRSPFVQDVRFQLQVMIAFAKEGVLRFPGGSEFNMGSFSRNSSNREFSFDAEESLGYAEPFAFVAGHETIERVLSEQVALYFQTTGGSIGKT